MAGSTAAALAPSLGPVDRPRRPALAVGRGHSRRSIHGRGTGATKPASSGADLGRGAGHRPSLAPRREALRVPGALGRAKPTPRSSTARRAASEPHRRRRGAPERGVRRGHPPRISRGATQRRPDLQDPRIPRLICRVERSKRGDRMVERCVAPLRGGELALIRGRRSQPVAGRSLRRPTNAPRRREDLHPGRRRRRGSIPSPLVRRRLAHPSRSG